MTQAKIDAVRAWLIKKNPAAASLTQTDDLVSQGFVNSLSFIEYILVIEDVADREIEMNEGLLDKVRTLEAVAANFFA